jgi:hypothetical protein
LDGRRVESPAPRTLDRFRLEALAADKTTVLAESGVTADDFFTAVPLPADTAFIRVDTGARKMGPAQTLLCSFAGNCP